VLVRVDVERSGSPSAAGETVRLRGGEQATVIPDAAESSPDAARASPVVTDDTLVFVIGSFTDDEIAALARHLRPLE
jgi:hypothetical protein